MRASARSSCARLATSPGRPCPAPEEREDTEEQKAVNALVDATVRRAAGEHRTELTRDERGRWLLAQLLNWHRREGKAFWWRYFYLVEELTDEERREEPDAIGELTFEESWPDPRAECAFHDLPLPLPRAGPRHQGGRPAPYDPETGNAAGKVVLHRRRGGPDRPQARQRPARHPRPPP